jgi:hypothetical protein
MSLVSEMDVFLVFSCSWVNVPLWAKSGLLQRVWIDEMTKHLCSADGQVVVPTCHFFQNLFRVWRRIEDKRNISKKNELKNNLLAMISVFGWEMLTIL